MNVKSRALVAALALSVVAAAPGGAEVPTAADFAGCNMKAAEQAAADSVSASPKTDLPRDATKLPPDARRQPAQVLKDPTGSTLSSDKDPQIEGMAADRANDPAYIAAYRACMRQRGF